MWRLLFVFFLIFPLQAHSADNGSAIQMQEPNDDQLRLLNVYLGNINLDEIITAYQVKENLMVPLGLLSEMLSLAISSRPEKGTAEGFILKENRRFYLDVSRGEVTLLGKTSVYPQNLVVIYTDDIYVEAQLLAKWFPYKLDVDLFSLTIHVRPTEPLPLQLRLDREKRIEKFRSGKPTIQEKFARQESDYQLLSYPFIDQSIGLSAANNKDSKDTLESNYTTYAALDLLFMESSLYLDGNNKESLSTYRITMGRKDDDASLLGPLKATEFSFGHINTPNVNLINSSTNADLGVTLSNHPLSQQLDFDTHTFEGNLLPGWEIELYHNNQLINYQTEAVDGQYRFENVALLFGNNFFRLVFYGPNGQQYEETHKFQLDRSLTRPGESHYRLSTSENNKTNERYSSLQYDIGLNKYASAKLGIASLPIDDVRHNYTSAGLVSFWKSFVLDYNFTQDNEGGSATDFGLQTKISNSNLKFDHTKYDSFISQTHSSSNTLTSSSIIRLDTAIPSGWLPRIPVTLGYDKRRHSTGTESTEFTNRLSTFIRGISVSNDFTHSKTSNQTTTEKGKFEINYRRAGKNLRNTISYKLKPSSEINSIAFLYGGNRLGPFRLGLGYVHYASNQNQYTVDLDKRKGAYSLNIQTTYNTIGNLSLNLRASMSFGRNPISKQWTHDSRSMANLGSAAVSAFMDENQNGIQDEEEPGLADVAFRINGARRTAGTDQNGTTFLTHLTPYENMGLNIAIGTLEDPFWLPAIEGVQITPRPGHTPHIIFPILVTAEIDGTVYIQTEGEPQYAGNVELQLVDENGEVVNTERSGFDGFYVMSGITMGTYSLRISPEQIRRLGLIPPQPKTIKITADEEFISGLDYVLAPKK